MSSESKNVIDEIGLKLRDLFNHLFIEGKRTAILTRLRMELSGLDRQRKDLFAVLGERVNDLRLNGQIIDAGLMGILQSDFEGIDRMTMKIRDTMDSIQKVNLESIEVVQEPDTSPEEPAAGAGGFLDSFQVL